MTLFSGLHAGPFSDIRRAATAAAAACRHWLVQAAAQQRRLRQERRELQRLDRAALRDLGLDLSEWGSIEAEAAGVAACTRRRVCRAEEPAAST